MSIAEDYVLNLLKLVIFVTTGISSYANASLDVLHRNEIYRDISTIILLTILMIGSN